MKKKLFIMLVASMAAMFTGCSKENESEPAGETDKIFNVQAPDYITRTREISVSLSVKCDTKPIVKFSTEGDAMGVVSPIEKPEFDTEYIYADELIDVQFDNGIATAAFWYFPLSAGQHGVSFIISYTQDGVPKTETSEHIWTVSDAFVGGFEPKVIHTDIDYGMPAYLYMFRNSPEVGTITGCDFRIAVKSFEGKAKEITIEKAHITMEANENVFCPIRPQSWNPNTKEWETRDYFIVNDYIDHWNGEYRETTSPSGPIAFELICRDNYNRCRDIVVKTDAEAQIVSTQLGDYYLWRNRK